MPFLTAPPNTAAGPAQARFWDRAARKYAAAPIGDVQGYENTLHRVQALLTHQHTVLELGCGTGSTALRLAAGTLRYMATDVSPEMIAIAREKLAAQPVRQLRFGVADAQTMSTPAATYDAVLAFNLLHLMHHLDDALGALLPALKPGGLFISKTPCLSEMNPLIPRLLLPVMGWLGKAPHVLCLDASQLRLAFERQGLQVEAVERHGTKGKDARVFIVARKV
jgi:ubiquinone/menaquinone biosynthesis C-methylase UbiE